MGSEVVQEDFFERSGAQSSGSDGSFSPSPDTSDQFAVRSPSEKEISAMLRVPSENVRNGFPGSIERVKGDTAILKGHSYLVKRNVVPILLIPHAKDSVRCKSIDHGSVVCDKRMYHEADG